MSDIANTLMQEFYLSDSYDPNADRPADTVKAAISYTLRHATKAIESYRTALMDEVAKRRVSEGTLSEPLDYTDWEEVSCEVDHKMRREGLRG